MICARGRCDKLMTRTDTGSNRSGQGKPEQILGLANKIWMQSADRHTDWRPSKCRSKASQTSVPHSRKRLVNNGRQPRAVMSGAFSGGLAAGRATRICTGSSRIRPTYSQTAIIAIVRPVIGATISVEYDLASLGDVVLHPCFRPEHPQIEIG